MKGGGGLTIGSKVACRSAVTVARLKQLKEQTECATVWLDE